VFLLLAKTISFSFKDSCGISESQILSYGKKLRTEIRNISKASKSGFDTDYASINLPSDKKILEAVERAVSEKKKLKPAILVVVGIGGSNLGTIAVHHAVNGVNYNESDPKLKVYFADTVDSDNISSILAICEKALKSGQNILVNAVTKSGSTMETVANLEVFVKLLKKYKKKDYARHVVATTGRRSKLWDYSIGRNLTLLEVPENVGGRYSVFSPVGLFPLAMLGVKVKNLLAGAASMIKPCASQNILKNPAALSAILLYKHSTSGKNINDNFIFSHDLESFGMWYRQLMGESIGKEKDRRGRKINAGITPTVSIGSTDLHSMAQLYLAGPYDKYTAFLRVGATREKVVLPKKGEFENLAPQVEGKSFTQLMDAVLSGVQASFRKNRRPYAEIILPEKTEYYVGQLMQMKMIEMMYLAHLLNVNPFDQPKVESYKLEARRLLAKN